MFLVFALITIVCGTAGLALLAVSAGAPLLLAVLGVFAALGVFLVFGVIAGHIRIAERTAEVDVLRDVVEHLEHGVVVTGPDNAITLANPAARELLGAREDGPPRLIEDAFSVSPDAQSALFRLHRAVSRGLTRSEDLIIPGGPGLRADRILRVTATPLGGGVFDGAHDGGILWSLCDMSLAKAREQSIRAALSEQAARFEALPAGIIVAEPDGRVLEIGARLRGWLGLVDETRPRELLLDTLIAGDGADLVRTFAASAGTAVQRIELELVRDDGLAWPATVVVGAPAAAVPGEAPKLTLLVLPREDDLAADVPEDEVAANGGLARLFRSAPFGIATVLQDGRIAGANSAFARLLLSPGSARGKNIREILANASPSNASTVDDHDGIEAAIADVLAGKANVAPVELTLGDDGKQTRRLFFGAGGRTSAGDVSAVIYVIDATEQKALEQKFAQSQKMEVVGKLAGGVAHDFNNVMTAIIGFSDLLLSTHRPGDPAYHNIKNIKSSADRAADLVSNLLAFSRQQQLQPKVLQLQEVITDISSILNRTLGERIELKIHSARDLWLVKADRNELERVVVNLAVNARDAMPDGGTLQIRTRNVTERESQRLAYQGLGVAEYVLIEVEDTGVGMPADVLAKIFEPFFTTKDVGKGTGLGLSTVYGIVKQTGGYIMADSTPGKGTTFKVYLPRFEMEEGDEQADEGERLDDVQPPDLTGAGRILLVEDEDAVRMFATQALTRQGYEVLQASDGYEALDLLEDDGRPVDLVVSDVKMPEMDGPTLLKELRKTQPDLKFVFVSGYPADAFSKTLSDEGNYTFLPKPYSLAQIAAVVKEQLKA